MQTVISDVIIQLETDLIDRSVRPIRLTPAGEVFYKEMKTILERIDFAISRTKEAAQGTIGNLTVGYTRGYERSSLSEELRHFHQQYPGIFVNCVRASSDVLASGLLLMMVAAEEGITILPDYYTRKLYNADNLLFVPMEGSEEKTEIYAFTLKENKNQALQIFLNRHAIS